jgi:hypothetical protein
MRCSSGFEYEISNSNHWGKGKPVVMNVQEASAAAMAGLTVYDIIEKIDNAHVETLNTAQISDLLTNETNDRLTLTVRNFDDPRIVTIFKKCHPLYAVSEQQMAEAFAQYDPEKTYKRQFTCPFVTTTLADPVDFSTMRTFDFAARTDQTDNEVETVANEILGQELKRKGLKQSKVSPDMLVSTYQTFIRNPRYKQSATVAAQFSVTRFDATLQQMSTIPFLSPALADSVAEYILQFGIKIVDQRIVPGRILWRCEANEPTNLLQAARQYAEIHVPLMVMQFPYVKYPQDVPFVIAQTTFCYTGIHYDIYQLNEVADVDEQSPAFYAGIKPRDHIVNIEGKRMTHSVKEFTDAYHQFVKQTLQYKNVSTQYTDANGFPYCMDWNNNALPDIVKAFGNDRKYKTAFAYLYAFEKYVHPTADRYIDIDYKHGQEKRNAKIPIVYKTVTHLALY